VLPRQAVFNRTRGRNLRVERDGFEIKVVGRHIPCAVHLESWQKLDGERHGGACLLLWSAVSLLIRRKLGAYATFAIEHRQQETCQTQVEHFSFFSANL
jgi:hypothetical protein